jgi:hypothetical protein
MWAERQTAFTGRRTRSLRITARVIGMDKIVVTHVPVARTLTEQESDFTAEGAPPPGKASTTTAVSVPKPGTTTPPLATAGPTTKMKRASKAAT